MGKKKLSVSRRLPSNRLPKGVMGSSKEGPDENGEMGSTDGMLEIEDGHGGKIEVGGVINLCRLE